MIVVLSNNSVTKEGYVQKELRFAQEIALEKPEETIFLIPLRLDDCNVPRGLRFFQWVDYFGDKKEESYSALIESFKFRHQQILKNEKERFQREKERQDRELTEKLARERAEREAAEKLAREKAERETAEKAARDKAEREAVIKAAREREQKAIKEKLAREATEKFNQEKIERRTAQKAMLAKTFFDFFTSLKSALFKTKPVFITIGVVGVIIVLFWAGSWIIPKLIPPAPTAIASLSPTFRPGSTVTITYSPIPLTKTLTPKPTSTIKRTPVPAVTLPAEITDIKGVQMVLVPAGEFIMGGDTKSEQPVQTLFSDSFYIDKYEVGNDDYRDCVNESFCEPPKIALTSCYEFSAGKYVQCGTPRDYFENPLYSDYPVTFVSWSMAKEYCEWRGARLPTEAEWEKSARGPNGHIYPWGDDLDINDCSIANYLDCRDMPESVHAYPNNKSDYGVFNMAGNVYEWVSSLYLPYPYNSEDGREDLAIDGYRVLRGGSFGSGYARLSASDRSWASSSFAGSNFGIRCARDATP